MRFEVIDRISIPSPTAALNEDAVGARDNAAWVVDGATGVSDLPPLVSSQSDAAWLAAQLDNEFDHAFQTSPVEPFGALATGHNQFRFKRSDFDVNRREALPSV